MKLFDFIHLVGLIIISFLS